MSQGSQRGAGEPSHFGLKNSFSSPQGRKEPAGQKMQAGQFPRNISVFPKSDPRHSLPPPSPPAHPRFTSPSTTPAFSPAGDHKPAVSLRHPKAHRCRRAKELQLPFLGAGGEGNVVARSAASSGSRLPAAASAAPKPLGQRAGATSRPEIPAGAKGREQPQHTGTCGCQMPAHPWGQPAALAAPC